MIVKEMKIGRSTILIDDCSVKYRTPEEVQPVLDRIADIVMRDMQRKAMKGNEIHT